MGSLGATFGERGSGVVTPPRLFPTQPRLDLTLPSLRSTLPEGG